MSGSSPHLSKKLRKHNAFGPRGWGCYTYAPFTHEKALEKIREKDPGAYHWLRGNEKLELWARFKFDTNLKCDDNTNNFLESFNHAIVKFRDLPSLTMLEEIRKLIGSRFVKRFEKSQK